MELGKEVFKVSGDPSLWLSASSKLAWAYPFGEEDEDAFKTAQAAEQLLLEQGSEKVSACIYGGTQSTLALMQAKTGQDPTDALLAAASQDPGDRAVALMEFSGADLYREAGLTYHYAGNYTMARKSLEKLVDPKTLVLKIPQQSERVRLRTISTIARTSLKMPDRDAQEIIAFLTAFIEGVKTLQGMFMLGEAWSLYNEITIAFPGHKDIKELRSLLPRRKKKAPDA
jgi:hypothetical protein